MTIKEKIAAHQGQIDLLEAQARKHWDKIHELQASCPHPRASDAHVGHDSDPECDDCGAEVEELMYR